MIKFETQILIAIILVVATGFTIAKYKKSSKKIHFLNGMIKKGEKVEVPLIKKVKITHDTYLFKFALRHKD